MGRFSHCRGYPVMWVNGNLEPVVPIPINPEPITLWAALSKRADTMNLTYVLYPVNDLDEIVAGPSRNMCRVNVCRMCGSLVLEEHWNDHQNWHYEIVELPPKRVEYPQRTEYRAPQDVFPAQPVETVPVANPEYGSSVEDRVLGTTEAEVWAREFKGVFGDRVKVDFGTILAWFANAIETGRAAGQKQDQTSDGQ